MRVIRFVLQVAIAAIGLLFSAVGYFSGDWLVGFGVAAFFIALFLFTFLLREHTETRLNPGRNFNPKVQGGFLVFPGIALWFVAWQFSFGRERAFDESLWPGIGLWAIAAFAFMLGCQILMLAYRVFRREA